MTSMIRNTFLVGVAILGIIVIVSSTTEDLRGSKGTASDGQVNAASTFRFAPSRTEANEKVSFLQSSTGISKGGKDKKAAAKQKKAAAKQKKAAAGQKKAAAKQKKAAAKQQKAGAQAAAAKAKNGLMPAGGFRQMAKMAAGPNDQRCVMCIYMLERLEQDQGKQQLEGPPVGYESSDDVVIPGPVGFSLGSTAPLAAQSPLPGPGYAGSFLETFAKTKKGGKVAKADGKKGGVSKKRAPTNCPEGMPYCRQRTPTLGRESFQRIQQRAEKNHKLSELHKIMHESFSNMIMSFPPDYQLYPATLQKSYVPQIASQWMHDYSNSEICVDIKWCSDFQADVRASSVYQSKVKLHDAMMNQVMKKTFRL
jgi:hypothetical protein